MSYYGTHQDISFDYPASTVTRAQGGFSSSSTEVIGRWVVKGPDGTVRLAGGTGVTATAVLGVITSLGASKVGVAVGPIVKGKRSGDTALAPGGRVEAATRRVASGGAQEPGFVNARALASITVAQLAASVGVILDGGAASTADTEPTSDEWVEVLMVR